MNAHRPGPWALMAGMPTNVLDDSGLRVARCDYDGDFNAASAHANARLIAAAPDLLDACAEGLELLRLRGLDNTAVYDLMRKAIERVDGAA